MSSTTRATWVLPIVVLLLCPMGLAAQSPPIIAWHGEVRPRLETRKAADGSNHFVTSMRIRLTLDAATESGLRLFIQPQDVRDWGEEMSERDRSADAVDFHQAFLEVGRLPALGGLIRVGRQEVGLGEERLLGAPDWGQAGQTFDGVRFIRTSGGQRFDAVYLKLQESLAPAHQHDADLLALWYVLPPGEMGSVELLGFRDRELKPGGTRQNTAGGIWKGSQGPLSLRLQGMFQFGRRDGMDVEAFMLAGLAGLSVLDGRGAVTLWYDYLSGDLDPGDDRIQVFTTLYSARNRYYGRADYFTDIPAHTGGLGLQDAALKLSYRPSEALALNLDLHSFRTAHRGDLSSQRLAEEADAWVRFRFRQHLTLQGGFSLTWGGPAMEELGRLDGRAEFFYLMTSLRF
jgi:hypothetical protein